MIIGLVEMVRVFVSQAFPITTVNWMSEFVGVDGPPLTVARMTVL